MELLKQLLEQISEETLDQVYCEEVYGWMDENGVIHEVTDQLDEAAQRAFKRMGQEIKRYFRCMGGPKDGMLVSTPGTCAKRKDPKKVRVGKRVSKQKKSIRIRKGNITKHKTVSRMVTKMNKRLAGG